MRDCRGRLAFEPLGAAYWYARHFPATKRSRSRISAAAPAIFRCCVSSARAAPSVAQPFAHTGVGVAGDKFDYRMITYVVSPKLGKGTFYRSFEKRLPIRPISTPPSRNGISCPGSRRTQTLSELRKLILVAEAPRMLENLQTLIEMDLGFELYRSVSDVKAALSSADAVPFHFDREGVKIEAQVTRRDFEQWIAPDIAKLAEAMERAIMQAGLQFRGYRCRFPHWGNILCSRRPGSVSGSV